MNANRVVHLVPALETGGMEHLVCQLAANRAVGRSTILCLGQPGTLGRKLVAQDHHISWLGPTASPLDLVRKLRGRLHQLRTDVLHCHNLQAFTFGALAARFMRLGRLVLTKHGTRMPADQTWGERFRRWAARRATLVAVSPEIQRLLVRWSRVSPDLVAMVPNGLDLSQYAVMTDRNSIRRSLGLPDDAFVVVSVGRLAPEKDHATLLRAFGDVARRIGGAQLLVVGDGPLGDSIRGLADDLGLLNRVHMLGNRDDVASILGACDLKVLASVTEGMPLTLLEAMAINLPVVATDAGGVGTIVDHCRTGLIVPPGQPSLLAQSIVKLARDRSLREAMGRAGRLRVEERFRLERTLDAYERLYRGEHSDRS